MYVLKRGSGGSGPHLDVQLLYTVNIEISAQYIFSRIRRMALDGQKYDFSEIINQNSTKRTNCFLRGNLVPPKGLMREKFSCAKYLC